MRELYDMPDGIWFKGKFIREGEGLYLSTSDEFFRGGYHVSRCLKASNSDAGVCVRYDDSRLKDDMRDFHRYCRVVYRAMRRKYGIERVQDECLRVFKVLYPICLRARNGEDVSFTDKDRERIDKIFASWNIEKGGELDNLTNVITTRMHMPMQGEELIRFCDDCMVVAMRIRKLTPRECFRLMGVDDGDIDKLMEVREVDDGAKQMQNEHTSVKRVLSNSSLYKLAGNSIVCDVLFHIFRKLLIEPEPDIVKGQPTQLSLF